MASLQSTYSTALGVYPYDRPVLNEKFFPLPHDKYVVIHNDYKLQSKGYEYFDEVIALLKPVLHKAGYKIFQVGGQNDPVLNGTDGTFLGISWAQSFYILRRAKLFVGIDSVLAHCSFGYDIPSVVLFSHTYPEQVLCKNWLAENKRKILIPEWGDNKPSYSAQESPKMIRTIKVEQVAQSVFNLLKLNVTLNMKTLYVGENFHEPVWEIIPDFFVDEPSLKNGVLHFRMDLRFDEQCLAAWLSSGYKINVISNRILNLDLLKQFKPNVHRVTLTIKDAETFSPEYLKNLKALGVPLVLIGEDPSNLSFLREKLFDYIIEADDQTKKLDNLPEFCNFWTKKLVLSLGKKFPSIAHWRQNKPLANTNTIIDDPEFWKDVESFYFYQ